MSEDKQSSIKESQTDDLSPMEKFLRKQKKANEQRIIVDSKTEIGKFRPIGLENWPIYRATAIPKSQTIYPGDAYWVDQGSITTIGPFFEKSSEYDPEYDNKEEEFKETPRKKSSKKSIIKNDTEEIRNLQSKIDELIYRKSSYIKNATHIIDTDVLNRTCKDYDILIDGLQKKLDSFYIEQPINEEEEVIINVTELANYYTTLELEKNPNFSIENNIKLYEETYQRHFDIISSFKRNKNG